MTTEPEQRQRQWSRIGPFRIERRLGTGGMGVVYLGYHITTGAAAAVKVLRPEYVAEPRARARLRRELAAAQRVPRSCTAAVLGADLDADPPWVATEYIDGPTLEVALLEHGRLSGAALEAFAAGVAVALRAIHSQGVIHRDLKPANVIVSPRGPRVIDFGIARVEPEPGTTPTQLTQPGAVVGTPAYMAPEQLRGAQATTAVDVFAWAGLVTFAATGHPPFGSGESAMYPILYDQPELGDLAEPLRSLVAAAFDKSPVRRPSAAELADRLVAGASEATVQMLESADAPTVPLRPPRGRRRRRALRAAAGAAAAVLVVAAATTATLLLAEDPLPLAGETITIGVLNDWEEGIAATFLWKAALERQGAEVETTFADVAVIYAGAAGGEYDIAFDAWLPATHRDYWQRYGSELEDLGAWYRGATLTIAVNDDAPIRSLAELAGAADEFGNQLVGIDPGAGLTRVTENVVIPTYGLGDMRFSTSSSSSMQLTVRAAIERGDNVVVTLWEPHWFYEVFPIRNLADPENALGDPDDIHAIARDGFTDDFRQVAAWVEEFSMSEAELRSLEDVMFHQHEAATNAEYQASVRRWLDERPGYLAELTGD